MTFLDYFRAPRQSDPVFGSLVFKRGGWRGQIVVPQLASDPVVIDLRVERGHDLSLLHATLDRLCQNWESIKASIAVAAFETYEWYVAEDLESGNFTKQDYRSYPTVTGPQDIWGALRPFRLSISTEQADPEIALSLDVRWPNPHYFLAYINGVELDHIEVDG